VEESKMSYADTASVGRQSARQGFRALGGEVAELDRATRAMTKEHPFLVLGGVLLLGYVCGRVASHV
jgi:hypothetical protein